MLEWSIFILACAVLVVAVGGVALAAMATSKAMERMYNEEKEKTDSVKEYLKELEN